MRYSPSHPANDLPRKGHIAVLTYLEGGTPVTTEDEKLHALGVLASQADSVESLREVALMLGLIDPPVVCGNGHDQNDHGVAGPDGRRYCLACRGTRVAP